MTYSARTTRKSTTRSEYYLRFHSSVKLHIRYSNGFPHHLSKHLPPQPPHPKLSLRATRWILVLLTTRLERMLRKQPRCALGVTSYITKLRANNIDGVGKFVWGGSNFAHSAAQIHLSLEGKDGTPWLHAQLNDRHGSTQSASVCWLAPFW